VTLTKPLAVPGPAIDAPKPVQTGRVAILDGLRLGAAMAVALYHLSASNLEVTWGTAPLPLLLPVAKYGWLGVEMFFVISGFVIAMSAWGRSVSAFAKSRLIRLFPAYWPAVILTATVVTLWPVARHAPSRLSVIQNLPMLSEPLNIPSVDPSYWTLWAEARFYMLFAVVVWFGLTRNRVLWFGYAWLIASVFMVKANEPLLSAILQPQYAPLFVAGIAFHLIHRFGSDLRAWGLVALSWMLSTYTVSGRMAEANQIMNNALSAKKGVLLVTAFFVVMAVIAMGWTARVRWRWLTTAGLLTYPFYLLHQNIGLTIIHGMRDIRPRYLTLAIVLVVLLSASWLLHRFIEVPVARFLRARLGSSSAPRWPATVRLPRQTGAQELDPRGLKPQDPEWGTHRAPETSTNAPARSDLPSG